MKKKNEIADKKIITVKNAEGEPDTKAEIVVQNQIDYAPKVSVIIPVYNVEQYLRQCLDSVVNQTLKQIEIICVDDGSTDSSLNILQEYAAKDKRITVIKQENLHAGVARNAGLAVAKGEYVHFLDSDDWIDLDTYKKLYSIISEQQANFVKFKSYTYDNLQKQIIASEFTDMRALKENQIISLSHHLNTAICMSDAPWSGLYNSDFLNRNKIRFNNFICANDTSFYFRCLVKSRGFYFIDDKFVYYRRNNSASLIGIRPFHFECQIQLFYTIQEIIKNESTIFKEIAKERFSDAIFNRFKKYIKDPRLDIKIRKNIKKLTEEFYKDNPGLKAAISYAKCQDISLDLPTPKVSVIIPVYNVEKYLRQCLDSVVNQTLREIEIICVDDGSTDSSLDILQEYAAFDKRIKIYQQEHNKAGKARNFGVIKAVGKYIYFVDSDDWIDFACVEKLYNKIEKKQADICIYGINKYDEITSYIIPSPYMNMDYFKDRPSDECVYKDIKKQIFNRFGPVFKIYNREFFIENNLFFATEISLGEDVLTHVKSIILAKKITFLDENLYYYRVNRQNSSMYLSKQSDLILEVFTFVKSVEEFLKNIHLFEALHNLFIDFVLEQFDFHIKRCSQKYLKKYITNVEEYITYLGVSDILMSAKLNQLKKDIRELSQNHYNESGLKNNIIISLTSHPARIDTVSQTIETLLEQSVVADRIILWLAEEQFPNKEADLPASLLALREKGLTIDWCHDIKSYKKLIPALKKYPDAIIVTADDDLLYDKDWLKYLYQSYTKNPQYIHCHRITRLYNRDNKFVIMSRNLYLDSNKKYMPELCLPSAYNKLSGGAGALFPPRCFTEEVFNEDKFMSLAPTSDDIWFWLMSLMNGYKVKVVDNNIYELKYVPNTQDVGLCKINDGCRNKIFYQHLNNVYQAYKEKLQPYFEQDSESNTKLCKKMFENMRNNLAYKLIKWYKNVHKKTLNLDNPLTFNEKIQWLKLYDSTPLKTRLADKYLVRDWVKEKIGEEYLIPLLGVYDRFEDIDFDKLPNQFVIKCNHGCRYNIIVKDKAQLDLADAKQKIDMWMQDNFAFNSMELHYRDIQPKIIIEKYIENKNAEDLNDYKFYCFNGEIKYIQIISAREGRSHKVSFYDTNWQKQKWWDNQFYDGYIAKPQNFDKMLQLANKLCQGFSFVRVDLYYLDTDKIYFGEMTFTPGSGVMHWSDENINRYFGDLITLPKLAYNIDTGEYYKLPKNYHKKLLKKTQPQSLISYKLFNFIPLFTYKKCDGRKTYKILGLPVWKIRKMANNITTKCYFCGIPLLKISDK